MDPHCVFQTSQAPGGLSPIRTEPRFLPVGDSPGGRKSSNVRFAGQPSGTRKSGYQKLDLSLGDLATTEIDRRSRPPTSSPRLDPLFIATGSFF